MRKHLAVLVLLVAVDFCSAATILVPSDQPRIQAAIDVAASGDTVLVAPGTYIGNISIIDKDIVLRSIGGADRTYLQPANSVGNILTIASEVEQATSISGFTFQYSGDGSAIHIDGGSPIVENNIFRNNRLTNAHGGVATIFLRNSSAIIRYNLMNHNGGVANIYLLGPGTIQNNTIVNSLNAGLLVYNPGAVVLNNIVIGCPSFGIESQHDPLIEYNDFFDNNPDYDATSPGPGDFSRDPMFNDPGIGDFGLRYRSPCVNAGSPETQYNDQDGTRSDMGALPRVAALPRPEQVNFGPKADGNYLHTSAPLFFWSYFDTLNTAQSAYEIEVGLDNDWREAELWYTGVISSGDTMVAYGGTRLKDHRVYWFRIRVYSGKVVGAWTEGCFYVSILRTHVVPAELQTVQGAIDFAFPHDTVLVKAGTYIENLNLHGKPIVLCSNSGPDLTVVEPSDPEQPVVVFESGEDSNTVLEGFTIRGTSDASGIYCGSSSPIIRHCVVTDCQRIGDGGGIYCVNSSAKIRNNVLRGNSSAVTGGGIAVFGRHNPGVEVFGNEIYENFAPNGPGIGAPDGYLSIERNLIYTNVGNTYYRAAVYIGPGPARVINNTIVANTAGILTSGAGSSNVRNNIITNHSFEGVIGEYATLAYNDNWNNGENGDTGETDFSTDPRFVDANNHNFHLLPDSPCIDAGDPDPAYNDPDGSRNDVGAFFLVGTSAECGDTDNNMVVNVSDVVGLLQYIFSDGPPPRPIEVGDVNADELVNIADAVYLIEYIFDNGPAPCATTP